MTDNKYTLYCYSYGCECSKKHIGIKYGMFVE